MSKEFVIQKLMILLPNDICRCCSLLDMDYNIWRAGFGDNNFKEVTQTVCNVAFILAFDAV